MEYRGGLCARAEHHQVGTGAGAIVREVALVRLHEVAAELLEHEPERVVGSEDAAGGQEGLVPGGSAFEVLVQAAPVLLLGREVEGEACVGVGEATVHVTMG